MTLEKEVRGIPGWAMLVTLVAILVGTGWAMALADSAGIGKYAALPLVAVLVLAIASFAGLTVVNPNQARVLTLFGVYKGTLKSAGFWWVNPLTSRRRMSLRVRNFESGKLKVNDHDGNPIEIAAVVVWRIVETYEAVFNVDDYEHFMHVQTEAAVRILATTYAYDAHEDERTSLRQSIVEVTDRLRHEIQDRLAKAGIEVIEARISHLAYAPEIA